MTGEEDAALTRELELRLRRDGAYDMNTAHRRKALRILRRVVRDWMRHIWRSRSSAGRLSSSSPVPEATVLTFGSCEMRVVTITRESEATVVIRLTEGDAGSAVEWRRGGAS